MPDKATAPIDLLKELRTVFEIEAKRYRDQEHLAPMHEQQAVGAKAFANEAVVKKIDATLRDWA